MNPLGDWILRQACHQASRGSPSTRPGWSPSPSTCLHPRCSRPTSSAGWSGPSGLGLPGELLVLEITERIMMADSHKASRQLGQLRKLGVRIAIDDFGTGYSSLAYLRDLPIDILKVDRSFVTPLGSDHQALALVKAIVGIADALDLDVIVRGRSCRQIELLGELGCQVVQGFYYGRPTGAQEFANRLSWSEGSNASRRRVDSRDAAGAEDGSARPGENDVDTSGTRINEPVTPSPSGDHHGPGRSRTHRVVVRSSSDRAGTRG